MKLSELGEERLLKRLLPHLPTNKAVVSGAGDDCAVVRLPGAKELLLLKTDCVVEGVHFTAEAKASAVGWKAMARPLSDFAAMAGVPQFALVTLIAPASTTVGWTTELYRGLAKAARAFEVAIVGGETSSTRGPIAISVSLTGVVEKDRWVSRSGGKAGDELFVTGRLGGSRGGRHLRFRPRIEEARWLTANFRVHAMMDLSDGLGADLPRLARASGVGFEVQEESLPRTRGCTVAQAVSDGEDYELLFAVSPNDSAALQKTWKKKFPTLLLTCIGRFNRRSKIEDQKFPSGYVHFQ
ncbi:MAG: thiamine-phosphate kinase [Chthoniobacterales bacterium]